MTDDYELTPRAHAWLAGFKGLFQGVRIDDPASIDLPRPDPFGFKML